MPRPRDDVGSSSWVGWLCWPRENSLDNFDYVLWPAMALPAMALAFGAGFSVFKKKPWLHWRGFGGLVLALQGPSFMYHASGDALLREPAFYAAGFWVALGGVALFVPVRGHGSERRWRTFGAMLLSLAALAVWSVVAVSVGLATAGGQLGASGVMLVVAQAVTAFRMGADGFHCLLEGSAPMPRPLRNRLVGVRFVGSIVCRAAAVVLWGLPAFGVAMCGFEPPRYGRLWILGSTFGAVVAPAVLVGVLWSVVSIVREGHAPSPELDHEPPAVF